VNEPAEQATSLNPRNLIDRSKRACAVRNTKLEPAVRSFGPVVALEGAQDPIEMSAPEDKHVVKDLVPRGSNGLGEGTSLLQEAQMLSSKGRHACAFALACTALEEIGKSQYAADVYTGFVPPDDFDKIIRRHEFKSAYGCAHGITTSQSTATSWPNAPSGGAQGRKVDHPGRGIGPLALQRVHDRFRPPVQSETL